MSRIGESLGKRKKEEKDFLGESRVSETLTKAEKNNKYSNSTSRIGKSLASANLTDKEKRARSVKVDEDYINSYISDVNKFYESAQDSAKNNTYNSAQNTANSFSNQWGDIEKKSGNIRAYLNRNKNDIPEETYTSLMKMLDENKKKTSDVSSAFRHEAENYGRFESEEAYKKAVEIAKKNEEAENYNLTSGKEELDALKTIKDRKKFNSTAEKLWGKDKTYEKAKETLKKYGIDDVSKVDIDKLTADKEQAYNIASATQSANKLRENALNAEDFNEYGDFSKYGGKGIIGKDAVVKSDLLTDEEKNIWAYYYNKKDYKTANDYLSSIQAEINEREGQQLFKDKLEGNTAKELSFSTLAGLDTARSGMQNTVNYLFNEKPSAPSAYQYASQLARADMEDVGDNVSVFGNSLGGAAYDFNLNFWNQAPQILAASMTGSPAAGLATMGTSVFGNAYSQMSELGYGKDDSTKYAVINTALELGLEKVLGGFAAFGKGALSPALSKVAGKISDRVPGVALKLISKYGGKIGADMLSEFTEESLQEILDPLVQTYTTHGSIEYTPTQISDALYAGLLGALSAGTMNSPQYVSAIQNTKNLGKVVKGNVNLTQGLVDTALSTPTETLANKVASKVDSKTSALKLGLLYHEVSAEMTNATKQELINNLKKSGYLQDSAEITADALADLIITGDDSKLNGLILDNEIVNAAALETLQGAVNDTFENNTDLQRRVSDFEDVQRGITTGLRTGVSTSMTPNTVKEMSNVEKQLVSEKVQNTVAEKVSQKEVPKVESFVNLNNKTKTVKLENGETVNLSDVVYSSDSEGLLIEGIADMGVNSATANLLIKNYSGDNSVLSVSNYLHDITRAYNAGLINYPVERLHNFSKYTDSAKVLTAWRAGKIQAEFDRSQTVARSVPVKAGMYKDGEKTTAKKVIGEYKGLNEVQKTSLEVIDRLTSALGIRVELFESAVENGRRVGENGRYENGTIYVDLYAGESGSGLMLRTVSHEMVHMMKDFSREHFDTLADFVIKNYTDNAVDVEELIERQQMIAKGKLSHDAAFEEVVADSLERMLTDTDALAKIEALAVKDKSLVKKMAGLVSQYLNKIKAVYKAYDGESYAVRNGLQDVVDEFQKLSDVFAEGIVNASKNIQAEKNTTTKEGSGGAKYSRRDYSYETLTKKPDMKITTVGNVESYHTQTTRKDIVNQAIKNAAQFGTQNKYGNVVISVGDIKTDVILSKNGLRHGLDSRFDELAPVTLKAGEILKNSIRINELLPRKDNISSTYILIGAAKDLSGNPCVVDFVVNEATNEVTSVDVVYSINKKEPTGINSPSGYANTAPYFTGSKVSISNLLEVVNMTFPDILPEEVLRHFGYTERPEGRLGENVLFSRRDNYYLKAVKDNNIETAQKLVDEAAKEAGYNSPVLYHGTPSFGFTEFDLSKMDDKRSIFLTSNKEIASTYSGVDTMRQISEKSNIDVDKLSIEETVELMNKYPPDSTMDFSYSYITDVNAFKNKVVSEVNALSEMIEGIPKDSLDEHDMRYINNITDAIKSKEYINLSTPLYTALSNTNLFKNDKVFINNLEQDVRTLKYAEDTKSSEVVIEKALGGYSIEAMTLTEAKARLKENVNKGNYSLYAKLENPFVIEANGNNWNDIYAILEPREKTTFRTEYNPSTSELVLSDEKGEFARLPVNSTLSDVLSPMAREITIRYGNHLADNVLARAKEQLKNSSVAEVPVRTVGKRNTRDISAFAKEQGYDGVIFKNLRDNGGLNSRVGYDTKADIYIVFNPSNVKSADPVTYDNNGDVIPLSERFNDEKKDIRFSRRDYTFSKALTSEEWKKYNNSMTTGVDAGLRINDNSTLVECENGDFEYKYVIYDNEVEDKRILAVYGIRTNYDRATTRKIAEYLYKLEGHGYVDERISRKIYNRIGRNYGALLGKYDSKNSRFIRSRRWNIGIGEVNGEGTSGEGVSEGVKYSRRDQFARDLKREYKYTDTVENVAKKLDSIEEMQSNATSSKDYQVAYDTAHALAKDIIEKGQVADEESLAMRKRIKDYLAPLKFYADEALKSEMIYEYGSWANFQKEMRSRGIKFTTKMEPGVYSLDSYWGGIVEEFGGIFSDEANALEQPIALANALDAFDGRADLGLVEKNEYIKYITDDILQETAPKPVFVNRRTGQAFDNRTLLVNALESAAKTDRERNLLKGYKENISNLIELQDELSQTNAEIKRLSFAPGKRDTEKISELQKEANRLGIRIGQTDRKLLQIEAMDSIKNLLQRERTEAYKKAKEEGKQALQEYRQKEMDKYNDLVLKNRAKNKKNIENRKRTELKHKILKQVNKLNSLLLNETKDKHVPISLKPVTAKALEAINTQMSSTDAQLEAKLREIEAAKTAEKRAQLQEQYDRMLLKNEGMKERLEALRTAYREIKNAQQGLYDEEIARTIDDVIADVGNTPLREMSLPQLEKVHDMYTMIHHTISEANKMHKAARFTTVRETAESFVSELKPKSSAYAIVDKLRAAAYNEDKPIYFFRRLGSKTGIELFQNILDAQDEFGKRAQVIKDFADSVRNKYGWNNWDLSERHTVTVGGEEIDVSLGELMSIYALSRREQAARHMERGGISLDEKPFKSGDKKADKVFNKVRRNPKAYRLSEWDIVNIVKELTPKQIDYVKEVQKFLSTDLSEWGNEASRVLYGIDQFKEENYFPINTDSRYAFKDIEALQGSEGIHSLRHKGFTKDLVKNATSPIMVGDFDTVWARHAGEMDLWATFVLPVDDFARVYSFTDYWNNEDYSSSVQTVLKGAFGEGATKYVRNLIDDINGNKPRTAGTNPVPNFLSTFKKTAVAASASVIIQQPTAIVRAMAYIDPKYFAHIPKNFSETYQEIKKYAGVAVLKEIGGFDMGSNRQFETWLNAKEYHGADNKAKALVKDSNYRDEVLMSGAGKADELGWAMIWNACLDEIATEKGLKGEALKIEAGKRFDEVVNLTQVYDSVLSRSGYMRDSSELVKMATAFMGEPTTSFNMLTDAIRETSRGNITKATAAKIIGSIFAAQIMAAIFKSIVGANRDDDDDKDWISKYAATLSGNLNAYGELNPLTWLPLARDLASLLQGFSIERTDLSPLTDLFDAFQDLGKDGKSDWRKTEDLIGSVGNFFGIPAKNLLRTGREIYNSIRGGVGLATGNTPTGDSLKEAIEEGFSGSETKKLDRLIKAIQSGKSESIDRARSYYEPSDEDLKPDEVKKKTNASIRSSLTSKYKKEYQKAWKKNDEKTMREIREILWGSKAYDSMSDVVEKTSKWIKDIKEE